MIRSVFHACLFAGAALALFAAAKLVDFAFFCHEAVWPRRVHAEGGPLPSDGFAIARPGEVVVVCANLHCAGPPSLPVTCHDDEACYCAPRGTDDEISRRFAAQRNGARGCVIDQTEPRASAGTGRCPNARCAAHLD